MDDPDVTLWYDALVDVIRRAHLMKSAELPAEVNAATGPLGLVVTIFLVDLEQRALRALPEQGRSTPPPVPVDGSLAGRVFSSVSPVAAGEPDGPHHLWIPLVDGTERLGVARVLLPRAPADPAVLQERCSALVGLIGHLIAAKLPYGDGLHRARRTARMSPAGELLLSMLPPLTFSSRDMVVSAVLEPTYDVGGDAFDYAVDGPIARLVVLDAMGRGTRAAMTCAVALSAIRASRRDGDGLYAMARAADSALTDQFTDLRYVTGVLAELNLSSGLLRYINAGHPQPLLMRHGRAVGALAGGRRLPMGIEENRRDVGVESLEPGDRLLLYTDGVTEARGADGEPFGVDRLVDFAERSSASGLAAPETLRRLSHQVMDHQQGAPTDDATLMLAEWSGQSPAMMLP
jgi:hypothetical protein